MIEPPDPALILIYASPDGGDLAGKEACAN
jgi:hypothetical protein